METSLSAMIFDSFTHSYIPCLHLLSTSTTHSWQWYDRDKLADPQNIDFTKYDRINYAFFQPCPLGNLYGTDPWADPQLLYGPYVYNQNTGDGSTYLCSWDGPNVRNCNYHDTTKGLLYLAQSKGVEVMPSIGGWTLSDNFPGIAASASKRAHFASQCVDLIQAYGFDGTYFVYTIYYILSFYTNDWEVK